MLKKNFIFYSLIFVCLASSIFGVEPSRETERFRVVFASHRDGNGEIYVMDADGRYPKNLTNNPEWEDGFPSCLPDGSKILFLSSKIIFDNQGRKRSHEDSGIYVMNADGSNPRLLNRNGSFPARWSPDGSKIVYVWEGPGTGGDIYVMDADGSNPENLTNHPANDWWPCWSPDGSKIAFDSNRDGNYDIYVMNPDGSNPINLTNHPAFDGLPIWSPDSSKIAFDSWRDGNREIYVMDADGSNVIRLTNNPAEDIVYDWSPDGRKIAFASNRDWQEKTKRWRDRRKLMGKFGVMFPRDMWEIYVMDADGRNQIRLTNNRVDDRNPSFLRVVGRPAASSDKGFALWGCAK
jgi:Tol biopolymer transport system component